MGKVDLEGAIQNLVANESISEQSLLLERLQDLGHHVSQPTLSRHLQRLHVRKINGFYRVGCIEFTGALGQTYRLLPSPPCMIVVRTATGMAQAAATVIDGADIGDICGTIAGDDTIFVALADPSFLERCFKALRVALEKI